MRFDSRLHKLESKAVGRRCSRCGARVCDNAVRIVSQLNHILTGENGEPIAACPLCGMLAERTTQFTIDETKARLAEVAREHFVPIGDSIHE